eukprot:RCo009021
MDSPTLRANLQQLKQQLQAVGAIVLEDPSNEEARQLQRSIHHAISHSKALLRSRGHDEEVSLSDGSASSSSSSGQEDRNDPEVDEDDDDGSSSSDEYDPLSPVSRCQSAADRPVDSGMKESMLDCA